MAKQLVLTTWGDTRVLVELGRDDSTGFPYLSVLNVATRTEMFHSLKEKGGVHCIESIIFLINQLDLQIPVNVIHAFIVDDLLTQKEFLHVC